MNRIAAAAVLAALGSSGIGCVAHVGPEPDYAYADAVPVDIETYPYVVYEGRPVYYVNDRWYYRRGPRWVYYRRAPEPIYRQPLVVRQRNVVRQAPPAPRRDVRGPEYAAPPARRVR